MSTRTTEYLVVTVFVTVMAAANLSIAAIGPWFLPVTAFFAVGVVLVSRDYLHDIWATRPGGGFWPRMIGMIAAAAVLSYIVNPDSGRVALASVCALVASSLTETVAFQSLFTRRWMIRSNGSNILGAVADSVTFPLVAFGFGMPGIAALILTQALTKALGGAFWTTVFRFTLDPDRRRAERAKARQEALA